MQLRTLELSKLSLVLAGGWLPKQGVLKTLSSGQHNLPFLGKNELSQWKFCHGKYSVWHKNPVLATSALKMSAWEAQNWSKQSAKRTSREVFLLFLPMQSNNCFYGYISHKSSQ